MVNPKSHIFYINKGILTIYWGDTGSLFVILHVSFFFWNNPLNNSKKKNEIIIIKLLNSHQKKKIVTGIRTEFVIILSPSHTFASVVETKTQKEVWNDFICVNSKPHARCLSGGNIQQCWVCLHMSVCLRALCASPCVCRMERLAQLYHRATPERYRGRRLHWPKTSLNLIHTRRQRTGKQAYTHSHPSRGQPPITPLCQLP